MEIESGSSNAYDIIEASNSIVTISVGNNDLYEHSSRSNSPTDTPIQTENDCQDGTNSKHGKVDPKICGVCGDKALGNNFNAITCESCKAFFRRNALKTKEFVCPFSDSCKVDPVTRRFCQKCRLKKCFEIGMKKEWIMTDEEKKMKKQKIEQNRLKRASSDVPLQQDSPATKVAVCMIDQKPFHPGRPPESTVPSSPPDPTVPHKIAKQPMMPHIAANGLHTASTAHFIEDSSLSLCAVESVDTTVDTSSNHNNANNDSSSISLVNGDMNRISPPVNNSNGRHVVNMQQMLSNASTASRNVSRGDDPLLTTIAVSQLEEHPRQPCLQILDRSESDYNNSRACQENENHSQEIYSQNALNAGVHPVSQNYKMSPPLPSNLCSPSHSNTQNSNQNHNGQYLHHLSANVSIQPSDHDHQQQTEIWNANPDPASITQSAHKVPLYYHQQNSLSDLKPYNMIPPSTQSAALKPSNGHVLPSTVGQFQHSMGNLNATDSYCPTTHLPLLSSLMRPGVAESPPNTQLIDGHLSSDINSGSSSISPNCRRSSNNSTSKGTSSSNSFNMEAMDTEPSGNRQQPHQEIFDINEVNRMQGAAEPPAPELMRHPEPRLEEDLVPLPLNTMDSILSVAITAEFNGSNLLGQAHVPRSTELNKTERWKLNELLTASQALNTPVDAEGPIKGSETSDPSLINVINLTDVAIRRLIKMSKKISGFKNMCQEDQIALLKGSCTEMMILRSVVSYDPDRDSWNIPHSNVSYNIKLGVLKEARGNLYEEHQRFVKSFKPEWRSDENIMIILCAITLFCAERSNVIHTDVVKLEQDSYYYLLKRYLESKLNGCEARSTYLQLIRKIAELHILNSNHLRVFLEVNPREVEPLLIEIFDLKQ